MGTLAPAGRIDEATVTEEIGRLKPLWRPTTARAGADGLDALLGSGLSAIDPFDRVQLAAVVAACRGRPALSAAGRVPFAASRRNRTRTNDADRLRKYSARFGLDWDAVRR